MTEREPLVLTSADDLERVLAALPADGGAVLADEAVRASGLSTARGWGALAMLCTELRATTWRVGGVQWAARRGVG